jgi:hypothetical protein
VRIFSTQSPKEKSNATGAGHNCELQGYQHAVIVTMIPMTLSSAVTLFHVYDAAHEGQSLAGHLLIHIPSEIHIIPSRYILIHVEYGEMFLIRVIPQRSLVNPTLVVLMRRQSFSNKLNAERRTGRIPPTLIRDHSWGNACASLSG